MERPRSHRLAMGALLALGLAAGSCSCDEGGVRAQNPVMIASFLADPDGRATHLVDFGVVPVKAKERRTIEIRNVGNTALLIKGTVARPFHLALSSDGLSLGPGASAELSFEYAPTEVRESPDELIFDLLTNEAKGGGKHSVRLVGNPVRPSLDCDPQLDFGDVVKGTEKSLSLRCSNPIAYPLQVQHSFMGSSKDFFSASVEGAGEVEANGSLTYRIKFRAEAMGRNDLYFSMVDAYGNPLATVEILANTVLSLLRIEPETCLDFGYVEVGATSERSLSIQNVGTDPVQILGFRISGDSAIPFHVATAPPIAIAPSETAQVGIRFQPPASGFFLSELEIETDEMTGGGSFLQACLSGFGGGPKLTCSPEAIDFGMVAVGMPVTVSYRCINAGSSVSGAPVDPLLVDDLYSSSDRFHPTIRNRDGSLGAAPEGYAVEDYFFVDVTYDPVDDSFDEGTIAIESSAAPDGVYETRVSGQGRSLEPCEFEVRPGQLHFGVVDRGGQITQDFAIENLGFDACLINDLRLSDDSEAAYSLTPIPSAELAPGETLRVPVTFAPLAYKALLLGKVQFQISNPDRQFQTVSLRGASASPCLSIEPAEIDFGRVAPGCQTSEKVITVSNVCQTPLRLQSARINDTADADAFVVLRRPLGRLLKPSERDEITVAFIPQDVGEFTGAVRIEVEDSEPYVATLRGEGTLNAVQTDVFDQKAPPKVDILWVIDNSGSMLPYQNSLATNLPAFLTFANNQNIDFRMALTTTGLRSGGSCPGGVTGAEDGRFYPVDGSRPRILTPTTPDLEEHWASNIMVGICHDDEQPYEAAKRALSEPLINEVKDSRYNTPWNDGNAGFLRKEASLSIIMVTDERDHAHEIRGNTMLPLDYVEFFRSVKGGSRNRHMVKLHAITGPRTGEARTCHADEGDRILVGVDETQGVWIDICTPMVSDNWAEGLKKMSEGAFGFSARFFLRGQPARRQGGFGTPTEADIEVFVDGSRKAPVNESNARVWTYDPETNAIDFTPLFIPKPGSQVSASYHVACLAPSD